MKRMVTKTTTAGVAAATMTVLAEADAGFSYAAGGVDPVHT